MSQLRKIKRNVQKSKKLERILYKSREYYMPEFFGAEGVAFAKKAAADKEKCGCDGCEELADVFIFLDDVREGTHQYQIVPVCMEHDADFSIEHMAMVIHGE